MAIIAHKSGMLGLVTLIWIKLKVMAKFKLVKGLPNLSNFNGVLCEGCQYGKAHRLPFDRSLSRCKVPLELIHSEFMGPTRTLSFSGYVYMLVFIDDFSRFTWISFVKHKSDVFHKFVEFKKIVEGELGFRIKQIQTYNGGEFTSDEFQSFCQEHGIRRELSCAETPQQMVCRTKDKTSNRGV